MRLEENKDLSSLNTMAVPATARFFVEAESVSELQEAISWGSDQSLPVYVIGGGSNVILESKIDALVIKPSIQGITRVEEGDNYLVTAGAGENWHNFVEYCVSHGYHGIENLALIPGNVGAAPIQNIGAYGVELKDVFVRLEALEISTNTILNFSFSECQFQYRESVFKRQYKNQFIILAVTLRLTRVIKPALDYPALRKALREENVSAREIVDAVIGIRQSKLPDPKILPNSGSFFKNPIVSVDKYHQLKTLFEDLVCFDFDENNKKLAAAWLIEKAKWKGKEKYGVKVHADHALVITNPNRCGAGDILKMVSDIQQDVRDQFGIDLEMEPQRIV